MSLNSHGVVLDTTLRDFYSLDENLEPDIVLIYAVPTAEIQTSRSLPLSTKFMYQFPLVLTKNADELARLYLQVVPQLSGFIAGNMPLVMFDLDIDDGEPMQSTLSSSPQQVHQADAFRVLDQLASSQRPNLSFVSSPKTIFLSPGTKAAVAIPMDCMLHLPHTVDPEVHYELLFKKNLALSGLPTPESEVIRTNLQPHQIYDESSLDAEVGCMMEPILNRTLPFVIKLPQSLSGEGVFLIHTESDRGHAIEVLRLELKMILQILNESTQDMQSCSLVAQKWFLEKLWRSLSFSLGLGDRFLLRVASKLSMYTDTGKGALFPISSKNASSASTPAQCRSSRDSCMRKDTMGRSVMML